MGRRRGARPGEIQQEVDAHRTSKGTPRRIASPAKFAAETIQVSARKNHLRPLCLQSGPVLRLPYLRTALLYGNKLRQKLWRLLPQCCRLKSHLRRGIC